MSNNFQKILLTSATIFFLSGCGGSSPFPNIVTSELEVNKKLPKVALTQRGIVTDMNAVAFEWKPLRMYDIDGVKIYRSRADSNVTSLIATIKNKYATHYVDMDVKPATKYHYTLRTYQDDSVSVAKSVDVSSKDVLGSVSWIYGIGGLPKAAKIIWRPHVDDRVEYYIIERRSIDDDEWEKIATLHGRLQAEYIDEGLKDKYTYRYRIRVKTYDGIISTPSDVVTVITKPLPPVVTGLTATTNLPKRIELKWDKSNYKDFERYYLYRAQKKDGHYELIAKLYNNHFVNKIEKDGAKYFYKVRQKDLDGLESLDNGMVVMGSTLEKPFAPTIQDVKLQGNKIVLKWFKIDPRSVSYIVKRKAKSGWFDTQEREYKTTQKSFIDNDIQPNTKYTYSVYAIDKYGIISKGSKEVTIAVKELSMQPQVVAPATKTTVPSVSSKTKTIQKEEISTDNLIIEEE